jgi:hypothetical protein
MPVIKPNIFINFKQTTKMKTKTLLTYGAIAVGAYLAYRYFMKPKAVAAASFTGNEDSSFYNKFTANEDAYNPFAGTIAVDRTGANPAAVKKAVRGNLLRRKAF